ncbi:dehydrogenase E1 and transketolase domain-containing protein 1 [Fistulina hepatica ATCC 64428]|uniref:Dehydrogenase E1 and transketolase domain-containing protein 1 n=1 Tax=Fistulina hepatica ATCC 64428 TaxID=1128425 RepID=A0A0D7AN24_9AGAR|nr:dehydrogenase E1 and transketolase domain-containing protein 1 [Fistulina hepatica ATCC 64428]
MPTGTVSPRGCRVPRFHSHAAFHTQTPDLESSPHPNRCAVLIRRSYHDESFGFRKPREHTFPDYTEAQLKNRHLNAPLLRYVDSVRMHGHRAARIDPLNLVPRLEVAALNPARYGLVDEQKPYDVNGIVWTAPVGANVEEHDRAQMWTLGEIISYMRTIYVDRIAYEYMHSPSKTERLFFSKLLESSSVSPVTTDEKRRMLELIIRSETLDNFLQLKFPNLKRYGLEGGESMIPALDTLFSVASRAGIEHIVLCMPHRGRLNLLTELLEFPAAALFAKITGGSELPEAYGGEGDVLSHLSASPELQYDDAVKPVRVSLLPNPSHLEAINPVALGKARAKQYTLLKTSPPSCTLGDRVMCVQLHGDASFTGQGIIMEGIGLSNLPHFTSGGSVHIVVNIGYTTPAAGARSSMYCSDIGKMIGAPVLHVNGDYPEEVAKAMEIAFEYRNYFRKDVIVDLLVYRRWHNELDLPDFTSPLMYDMINSRRSVPALYEEKLTTEGIAEEGTGKRIRDNYKEYLQSQLVQAETYTPSPVVLQGQWSDMVWPTDCDAFHNPATGVSTDVLKEAGHASIYVPEGFTVHPKLNRHIKHRLQGLDSEQQLDFATAEAMSFGSLLREGYDIRISGQDVGRGTFSQRHAMLVDQKTEQVIVPLNDRLAAPGKLELANSSLSEFAVLGFEYGVSWERPTLLPIWEAQFGDFFNGAQIIIDTFISSAETKWLKQSALVLLLPHGLDGAGPEHSSSRIERMLQLTNDPFEYPHDNITPNVNMHVIFPTTSAQYFHLLRRQMKRNYRKPLIVASPKGLLRLPAASSSLADMALGTAFQPVIDDATVEPSNVARVVLVAGKFYYELSKERVTLNRQDVALVRIEELCPFPFISLRAVLARYPRAKDYLYVQEEPRNQGAFPHVRERANAVLDAMFPGQHRKVRYVGRCESAVPAPGIAKLYTTEQRAVLLEAFA